MNESAATCGVLKTMCHHRKVCHFHYPHETSIHLYQPCPPCPFPLHSGCISEPSFSFLTDPQTFIRPSSAKMHTSSPQITPSTPKCLRSLSTPSQDFDTSTATPPLHTVRQSLTLQPRPHLLLPPEDMNSTRKFSYASVKEEPGDGLPQSFESSLSSSDLEEVEWIAWPCTQWCKTKGLCSYHYGGTHEDHVSARLSGYLKSQPRKLQKILDELEKRRSAQKLFNLPFAKEITRVQPHPASFSLDIWREKVRESIGPYESDLSNEVAIFDDFDELPVYPIHQDQPVSYLESMPQEILDLIFSYVTVDHTADPYARPHVDLASCALASSRLHAAAVRVMYRHVSIPQSKAFFKLMRSIGNDKALGEMVQWLDFSHYSNMGFGSARNARNQKPYLTPTTLKACLDLVPNLQAFLVHEHIDDELNADIISTLLKMPLMSALDFCACSCRPFTQAFTQVCENMDSTPLPSLKGLSLHECTTLQPVVFETLLPRLASLTHLDVAHTLINDKALFSIPETAKITHLNLERCTGLQGSAVVKFITTHPAIKDSIVYLNLSADSSRHRLLSEVDVSRLLASLPPTVRSLNLGGARVNQTHIPALRRLSPHLEELGLRGADLSLSSDIKQLFKSEDDDSNTSSSPSKRTPYSSLRYIDLTNIKSVTQMSLSYSPSFCITDQESLPLEVIELSSEVLQEVKRRNAHIKRPEWVVKELGRRGWYVRQPLQGSTIDDGSRPWKMGARWWGMRKVPIVEQDVGGMYGYFMFKRS
ncbi:hypothetical protein PV10_01545 [Exophiala mesophila]|uniref:F-box domain-containing protein n=1 Tax=Exophiala mesophila TaxID=212818 RepID=A0A0D1X7K3_EXOME|nr:uncharacterized protein PV10_01545 [Exophiala mesophila]KIV97840.1 hypothetical protein PV10_01545 [Exophiala mesophila]